MIENTVSIGFSAQAWIQELSGALADLGITQVGAQDALLALFLLSLAVLIWVERRRPRVTANKVGVRRSYTANLQTYFFNEVALSLLQLPALYAVASEFSGQGLFGEMENGFAKTVLALLLLDLTMYGWHWVCHHCNWLWPYHRTHHSDRAVNVTTALRYHPGELILEVLVRSVFIVLTGIDVETLLISQGVMTLFILMHHSNVDLPGEAWLSRLFITPSVHRLHHSAVRSEHDHNYGCVLSIWDRLFGTMQIREPRAIGLYGVEEDSFASIVKGFVPGIGILESMLQTRHSTVPQHIPVSRNEREGGAGRRF